MLPDAVAQALSTLDAAFADRPDGEAPIRAAWRDGTRAVGVPDPVREAADLVAREVPPRTQDDDEIAALGATLRHAEGGALLAFFAATTARRDLRMAPLLVGAARAGMSRATEVARDRVVDGPLRDALACAPILDGALLATPDGAQARARLEILVWEAGASALEVPDLGPWIWGDVATFDAMIDGPAHGSLRGRVLAARCLEIAVGAMPPATDPDLVARTLQLLQPLLLHPEPLVWVHAARALGRLAGPLEHMVGTLMDWVNGESQVLRQRAITAFASLPAERLGFFAGQLAGIIRAKDADAWVLAAVAAATPYLFFERRDLWDRLAARVLAGDGGAISARALARGLVTLRRRGDDDRDVERTLRSLREVARGARVDSLDASRRWLEIVAVTDVIDAAERDPLDLELGLENLVRVAAQYDDEEADARAARFAMTLRSSFEEARRVALGAGRLRSRAAAVNAVEGCARAFALRLWGPLLATHAGGSPVEPPDLEETWKLLARAPAEILDVINQRRADGAAPEADLPLEVLAIRLGGYALDACGEDAGLGPGRGATAHDTCMWLRKLEGLADGSRALPPPLESALSALFWRLVDAAQGSALGEVDDAEWLGPFAAWSALVIDRPAMLLQLATALPMIAETAVRQCLDHAEALRAAVTTGIAGGAWGDAAAQALASLHAGTSELAAALAGLSDALVAFADAAGHRPGLEDLCTELVLAAGQLHCALADPVRALGAAGEGSDVLSRTLAENAPRVAPLVARAVRSREIAMLDVWFASLGPVTSKLVEAAVGAAIRRTRPPPPSAKKTEPQVVEGYELVKALGEGGIGKVWLVRKPGADRLFVLKIPKADALASATDVEREGILASFVEEAKALAGLYHPNVANIIDRGVSGTVPYLVLEYLIGADLKQYSWGRPMTLFELRRVVLDACAGLAALHGAGLVHRDIKPANLWLRLPLAGGVIFDPARHRYPAVAAPLSTVVIDFGMVRAARVSAEVGGRFVAGTAGYIAPEQVLDPVELDPRADVYALAGTIYNVTTNRAFFDDIENPRDRILAHMRRDPFEDATRLRDYPAAIAKLLRASTALDPKDRPGPMELGREFAAAV